MSRTFSSKIYSHKQYLRCLEDSIYNFNVYINSGKKGIIKKDFSERIMLAVTEVNGCALCAYGHTAMALQAGVSTETINSLLSGDIKKAPQEEAIALLFAQHYADTESHYTSESWESLNLAYGEQTALGILAHIQVIMIGNIMGISFGNLINRLKKKNKSETSLWYELSILLCTPLYILISIIKIAFRKLFFKKKK